MVLRFLQQANAYLLILVTLSGIVKDFQLKHLAKVYAPMLVTPLFEIVADCKLLQPLNAAEPILVTPSGSTIDFKLSQSLKAHLPILVTPSGIVIVSKLLQEEKTP